MIAAPSVHAAAAWHEQEYECDGRNLDFHSPDIDGGQAVVHDTGTSAVVVLRIRGQQKQRVAGGEAVDETGGTR